MELHYHHNTFKESNIPNKAPDSLETSDFWSNIWSIPGMIIIYHFKCWKCENGHKENDQLENNWS